MSLSDVPQPPLSKKKQALMPSTPLRRELRAYGHSLSPLVRIGKEGISHGLVRQLTLILFDHELCKVKLESECPVDRFAVAAALGELPGVNIVQILGRTILVYKRHPQQPKYEGTRDKVEAAPKRRRSRLAKKTRRVRDKAKPGRSRTAAKAGRSHAAARAGRSRADD
ncbi:MAG: YhbY family RNA-binding protein [Deltaproteobacteria bacterium]|nr:YhbY family RNA-binding protein [Deltaproteobacteria bacterium]